MNKNDLKQAMNGFGLSISSGFAFAIGGIAATELVATCKDPIKRAKIKKKVAKPFKKNKIDSNIIKLKKIES